MTNEKLITLLPNSARLKQVIKKHGAIWRALTEPRPMQCFGNDIGVGIESLDGRHFRNVRLEDIIDKGEDGE